MLKITVLSDLTKIRLLSMFRYFDDQLNIDYMNILNQWLIQFTVQQNHHLMTYSIEIYAEWGNFRQQVYQCTNVSKLSSVTCKKKKKKRKYSKIG